MKFLTALLTLSLVPAALSAQVAQVGQVVGPSCVYGDPAGVLDCRGTLPAGKSYGQDVTSPSGQQRDWWADKQGAFAEVTRTNPQAGWGDYSQGSLELRVVGTSNTPGSDEWGFWNRYAGGASYENSRAANYGALSALTSLSFDWFRQSNNSSMALAPSADWRYKTPVMRLRLLETDKENKQFESEIVWEGYFNKCSLGINVDCDLNTTRMDSWVTQNNMQGGKFWYARPPGEGVNAVVSSGANCGLINQSGWSGGISAFSIVDFMGSVGGSTPCIGANTVVSGIAVGIGSRWPLPYTGFVDNVRMGFNGTEVMNTNFDFIPATTVPEPSTWALMGAGLLALGVVSRRRKRSAAKD